MPAFEATARNYTIRTVMPINKTHNGSVSSQDGTEMRIKERHRLLIQVRKGHVSKLERPGDDFSETSVGKKKYIHGGRQKN